MSILNQFFKNNNKLKAMLSFQDLYIGLSPYEAPAVFSLLQALEFERGIIILTITLSPSSSSLGIYYPQGGFQSIAQSLEQICANKNISIIKNCEGNNKNTDKNIDTNT
jgi:phytoene desaturase (3,4-didehydrolycopene-forming)